MEAGRIRHRQGPVHVVGGVPYPDKASTLSLLPRIGGGPLAGRQRRRDRGRFAGSRSGNQPFRPWYERLAKSVVAVDAAPAPGLDVLSFAAPLPFRDASFDVVLCTSVLEHVDNAEAAIAEVARTLRPGRRLIITAPFLYPTHEAPYDFWRTTHFGLRSILERHGLDVGEIAAQGGPFLLVAHYLIGGFAQALMGVAGRLGKFGFLLDNRIVRGILAAPQQAVRSRISYRATRLSRAASLGYMAVARKPAQLP